MTDEQGVIAVVAGFPITSDVSLRKRGEHEDVSYEIVNHSRSKFDLHAMSMRPSSGTWCYYVMVNEAMLPPELFAEFWLDPSHVEPHRSGFPRISYDYYGARFAQVDWHGGVTFYEKSGGIDGARRYVKIGCDFAHLWDEDCEYDLAHVETEAKATINQLMALYSFNRRCPYYGSYHPASEMVEHNGRLYSVDGKATMESRRAEQAV